MYKFVLICQGQWWCLALVAVVLHYVSSRSLGAWVSKVSRFLAWFFYPLNCLPLPKWFGECSFIYVTKNHCLSNAILLLAILFSGTFFLEFLLGWVVKPPLASHARNVATCQNFQRIVLNQTASPFSMMRRESDGFTNQKHIHWNAANTADWCGKTAFIDSYF